MNRKLPRGALIIGCLVLLAACAGRHRPLPDADAGERPKPFHSPVEMLMPYDADHDGTLTRAEMEAGLKADFAAADINHDGVLDEDETRAVNQTRWSEGASTASPLVDWNHDGHVDFTEFAATARSLFDEIDRDGDSKLSPEELQRRGVAPGSPGQGGGPGSHRRHPSGGDGG